MASLGIDKDIIRKCVSEEGMDKLDYELRNKAWSPRALRVNGWRYKGMLDADLVTRAVCSGFVTKPPECETLLRPRDPTVKYIKSEEMKNGVTFKTVLGTGAAVV